MGLGKFAKKLAKRVTHPRGTAKSFGKTVRRNTNRQYNAGKSFISGLKGSANRSPVAGIIKTTAALKKANKRKRY